MICRMDHIVLNVTDMEPMLTFYCEVLQLEPERVEAWYAGKVPFPSVRLHADTIIDLFPEKLWGPSVTTGDCGMHLNHFCLSLDKEAWDALHGRLAQNDVAVEDGPAKRWGAHGTGVSIYFRDPENNLIEARYYEAPDDRDSCLLGS